MSREATLLGLSTTISGFERQIEELKQDKHDLRSDKESLKCELTVVKEELRAALADASQLRSELEGAKVAIEYWKSQRELERGAQVAPNRVSHQSASVQNTPNSKSQMGCSSDPIIIDESLPAAQDASLAAATTTVLGSPNQALASDAVANHSPGQTTPRAKKRKAVTTDGDDPRKRSTRRPGTDARFQQQWNPTAPSMAIRTTIDNEPVSRGRPVVSFKGDQVFVLPPHILQRYLEHAPPLDISPPPSDVHVSRDLLRDLYGGSLRQATQHITAFDNPSGNCQRAFTFPRFDLNPGMPLVPGHGGVIIAPRHNRKTGNPWGLFRGDITGKTSTWVYMGEYEWNAIGTMDAEVFRGQTRKVKEHWADELLGWKQGLGDHYPSKRARIALRIAGMLPSGSSKGDKRLVKEELERMKSKMGHPINREQIISAFERGEEGVDVILLRCVSYDRTLALDIEAKSRNPQRIAKRRPENANPFASKSSRAMAPVPGLSTTAGAESDIPQSRSSTSKGTGRADDSSLGQGMNSVHSSIVSEDLEDDLSYGSDDGLEELSYP